MQLTQLGCLIVIGTLCGVKGRTILIDWTLAGVQNYTERYNFRIAMFGPVQSQYLIM